MTEKSAFHLKKSMMPAKETDPIKIANKSKLVVSRPNSSRKNR
jgi:hypothetical protein